VGERRYLNGAVIRLDRKATIELLSDAAFLLETHVIQASEATTPLRRVYFVVQVIGRGTDDGLVASADRQGLVGVRDAGDQKGRAAKSPPRKPPERGKS
jgi:flagellar biosynthesis regulator FlbT